MCTPTDRRSLAMSAIEGGRGTAKNEQRAYERGEETPAARAISDSPAVRSPDKERHTLSVTSDEKKGRCRLHGGAKGSGGPRDERNGQYRHGERTKAAIAEQRRFGALLKMLRAGLT